MNTVRTAIHRPVSVFMVVVAVLLFGAVSLDRLALNLLPDISYPSITVQTDYEDAAPEEIETLITRPLEETVAVVSGLNRISSTSRLGQSEIVLEFVWDTNMDLAGMEVREKIDFVELPRDVEKPVILRFDPSNDPIQRIQVYGELSLARLRDIAERDLKKRIEALDGVAAVKVTGGREEQIRIEVDEKRLAELGIPITTVTSILQDANLNQAGGSLYDLEANYNVRMLNEFRTVEDIRRIVVQDTDGRQVLLHDVARVWRGAKDRGIIARYDGNESVEMAVYKEGDANTVTVSEAVRERLDRIRTEGAFPKAVETAVVFDQAEFISQSISNVLQAALFGGILATFVLFVFLRHMRSTLIIGASIPISIMATFTLMYQTGISLNIMSLGGIALGVGMLVDNSIVVLESVYRHRKPGAGLAETVYRGTREVGMAVTASTLTTVAVFLPLVFVEGIAGQLFTDQALTITYSLLSSLAVALTFIPMLLAFEIKAEELLSKERQEMSATTRSGLWNSLSRGMRFGALSIPRIVLRDVRRCLRFCGRIVARILDPFLNWFDRAFGRLSEAYPYWLEKSLDHKTAILGTVAAAIALSVIAAGFLGGELIPPLTQGEFSFEFRLPDGKPLEATDAVLLELEESVRRYPGVARVFSSVGGSQKNQFASGTLEENIGTLHVVMTKPSERLAGLDPLGKAVRYFGRFVDFVSGSSEVQTLEDRAIRGIREQLAGFPEVSHRFSRPTLFSFKTPVEVELFTYEVEDQRAAANLVAERLERIEGLYDIQTSTRLGNPEVQIRFDRFRMSRLGLAENQVAILLRNKIRGDLASRYRQGDRQIDIVVRAGEQDRDAVSDIRDLIVNSPSGAGSGAQNGMDGGQEQSSGRQTSERSGGTSAGNGARGSFVPIRLQQVADVSIARGPSEIRRIRSQRAAVVSASITGRDLTGVSEEIRAALTEIADRMPLNTTVVLGGQNEEFEASYDSLMFALALAVFLVYLVMASQFESLIHPFIILFTLPLALVGVVLMLALTGTAVSVVVLLGVIVLAGIVVNNAIVLIDYTNQLRCAGRSKREALIEAAQTRLRPILMTTLTTVLGLAPMSLGWGEGDEVRAPMAVAVMGGLAFSTLLTLILIPVVYDIFDRRATVPADHGALPPAVEKFAGRLEGAAWGGD